jgi:hypothetical protein
MRGTTTAYGSYNPRRGYYANDSLLFAPLSSDDRYDRKRVVLGARTTEGAVAFPKDAVRERRLVDGAIGETPVLAVHDGRYDAAYVYRTPTSNRSSTTATRLSGRTERPTGRANCRSSGPAPSTRCGSRGPASTPTRASMSEALRRTRTALSRTGTVTATTLRRRDGRAVFAGATALYLVAYLWAVGHLAPGLGGYDVLVIDGPLATLLRPEADPFTFRPVARVSLGPLTYLFSLNTVLGLGLAALVGLNLALTSLARRQPEACGLAESSTGLLAGVPALLSGTACCGPAVLIVLGIQASGVLLTAVQSLLPVAAVLLVGSLVLVGRQVRPREL